MNKVNIPFDGRKNEKKEKKNCEQFRKLNKFLNDE
jgi:hypothetical protein